MTEAPALGADGIAPPQPATLSVIGAWKSFGGAPALASVDFDVRPGEVHALVGLNGAGKSTLVGLLSGALQPDRGTIRIDGDDHDGLTPRKARELGISTVPQKRDLVPELSVAENLMLGDLPSRGGVVDWRRVRREARGALDAIGLSLSVRQRTADLSAAEQTMIEIAREVHRGGRILILDEPTAALGGAAADEVRALVKRLRAQGKSIIYISHHLEEIVDLADRVTVLRDGKRRLEVTSAGLDISKLVYAMVGDRVVSERPVGKRVPGKTMLALQGISVGHRMTSLDLDVRAGEVVAVLGPAGDAQSLLYPVLSGMVRPDAGGMTVDGRPVRLGSVGRSLRCGLRCVPGARLAYGVVGGLTVDENLMLARDRFDRRVLVGWRRLGRHAAELRKRFGVVALLANPPIAQLSGGNQQKVLLAKWLEAAPAVCLLEEPTGGVDVRAKSEIHAIVDGLAASGTAVLLASSDVNEVLRLADRVVVVSAGRVVGHRDAESTTRDELVALTVGDAAS